MKFDFTNESISNRPRSDHAYVFSIADVTKACEDIAKACEPNPSPVVDVDHSRDPWGSLMLSASLHANRSITITGEARPFMHWWIGGDPVPCYASNFAPEGRLITYTREAPMVVAHPSAWALQAAHNLASAYRPEGL